MNDVSEVRKVLQGRSVFVGDILNPTAHWLKVKRSSIPHGIVRGFVFPTLPKGVKILRSRDIPGKRNITMGGAEVPILNEGEVRYVGEPILLLVGPDPEVLEDISRQILVLYEELPPRFDFPVEGETKGAPPVFSKTVEIGDTGSAFRKAPKVLEGQYFTGFQEHYYGEPHGTYVHWEQEKGSLEIHTSSRWPFHVHRVVQETLSVPWELISVYVPSDPDISLDGKLWYPSLVSAHAALACWITRTSIKYLYSREEDFLFTPKRAPARIQLKAALDEEGNLTALEGEIWFNMGAYPVFAEELLNRALFACGAAYGCPNLKLTGKVYSTNLPPAGAFTGMGGSQSQFGLEVFIDEIAQQLGISPVEWRKRNLSSRSNPSPWSTQRNSLGAPAALLYAVQEASDFERKHAAYELLRKQREANPQDPILHEQMRGIGFALAGQGSGFFMDPEPKSKVEVRVSENRKVSLVTSAVPGSYGIKSIWKRMAADALGVPLSAVTVEPIKTRYSQDSGPSIFSRNITLITKLLETCCAEAKKGVSSGHVPIRVVKTYNPRYSRSWNRWAFKGNPFAAVSWAAAAVEVSIDPLSFKPELQQIWMWVEAGKIFDEGEARKTIELGIGQAIGWALLEYVHYVEGRIPPSMFWNYRIASPLEVPLPRIEFLSTDNPKMAKGVGELALSLVPPALINALSQALGRRVRAIPYQEEIEWSLAFY